MARAQDSFNKREREKLKEKKRKEKAQKKLERKENEKKSSFEDMLAYVDENGMITSTPPEHAKKEVDLEDIEISVPRGSNVPQNNFHEGVVSFFNESKGYGFIRNAQSKEQVFFHIKEVDFDIKETDRVSYEVRKDAKGQSAYNISKI